MLFVIDKPGFQRVISIVRDDRTKKSRGLAGPFLRLEAKEDYVKLDGLQVSAKIPATVYEPGVLFLKVTLFRKLLQTFKGEKFLTIQVTADWLLMGYVRLALESNEMLLYADPDQAPLVHPALAFSPVDSVPKPRSPQLLLLDETDVEIIPKPRHPSWLCWNEPDTETRKSDK
ncbi:MAG: hypothetical protein KKA28_17820 [Planctomycetes bacterium]|nr:hypothetical protein [Planctomycetota bacterium]MCG2685389.1 hypothetical protein [Planctomycetales bacterium]